MQSALAVPAEDALVAGAREGNLDALEAVYRAFEVPVYNLVRRICKTPEDAEDVLQETFFEVCRSISSYRGDAPLWSWIRKVAASKALMNLRREKYRAADEYIEESTERLASGSSGARLPNPHRSDPVHERMDLEVVLARLSTTTRAVVWLHDVEGYTHEEIAELMGKSVSFSKSQLARAHARLRSWLTAEG